MVYVFSKLSQWVALGLLLAGCVGSRPGAPGAVAPLAPVAMQADTLRLVDPARQRLIPIRTYAPAPGAARPARLKLALLNHGYGGSSGAYTFLARTLVAHGYLVASLQQDLPGDAPLPTTGTPRLVRRPHWERGVQSMRYALRELPRRYPGLDTRHLLLVGHSNGGDMVMLFAQEYPRLVERVISLDNRRMPLPRARRPRVLSLRSSDQVADAGVLPTPAEQARYGTQLVLLPATRHDDMWDGATPAQQQEISAWVARFLAE